MSTSRVYPGYSLEIVVSTGQMRRAGQIIAAVPGHVDVHVTTVNMRARRRATCGFTPPPEHHAAIARDAASTHGERLLALPEEDPRRGDSAPAQFVPKSEVRSCRYRS